MVSLWTGSFVGEDRTKRSGENANKSGRGKRELSTGGGGGGGENYSPESLLLSWPTSKIQL